MISFDDSLRDDEVKFVRSNQKGYVVVIEVWKTYILKVVVLAANVVHFFRLNCVEFDVFFAQNIIYFK